MFKWLFRDPAINTAANVAAGHAPAPEPIDQRDETIRILRAEVARTGALLSSAKLAAQDSPRLLAENLRLRAELARWKPARDAKGHFVKADAAQERA